MQHFAGIGVQGLLIVLLVSSMLALTIFTFKPAKHSKKDFENALENGEVLQDEQGACGLKDLLANIFVLVYPMLFLMTAWVISYKYSALLRFCLQFSCLLSVAIRSHIGSAQ